MADTIGRKSVVIAHFDGYRMLVTGLVTSFPHCADADALGPGVDVPAAPTSRGSPTVRSTERTASVLTAAARFEQIERLAAGRVRGAALATDLATAIVVSGLAMALGCSSSRSPNTTSPRCASTAARVGVDLRRGVDLARRDREILPSSPTILINGAAKFGRLFPSSCRLGFPEALGSDRAAHGARSRHAGGRRSRCASSRRTTAGAARRVYVASLIGAWPDRSPSHPTTSPEWRALLERHLVDRDRGVSVIWVNRHQQRCSRLRNLLAQAEYFGEISSIALGISR
jgi:hypothetical protein